MAVVPCPSTEARKKLAWWLLTIDCIIRSPSPVPGICSPTAFEDLGQSLGAAEGKQVVDQVVQPPDVAWAIASISAWFASTWSSRLSSSSSR